MSTAPLLTNYHTHTLRCKHAIGVVADYVAEAAKAGCAELGFSDHCPYPALYSRNTWPESRMSERELSLYVREVRQAAETAPFPVLLGFECEWGEKYRSWYSDELLAHCKSDYLIFGPHWVVNSINEIIYAPDIKLGKEIALYFAQTIQGIESGLFAFVAHPDLIMADGREWSRELAAGFSDVIDAAIAHNLPLEVNGYGIVKRQVSDSHGKRYQYPHEKFWELALEKGASVICNSDAHKPDYVMTGAKNAFDYASRFGLRIESKLNRN
ncbi:MAG: PHP domain-containing protein [Treponemataceae bacterium]|nr:MAG: PHP domain-containing protein [Treponemataceae bacterium]